MTPIALVQISAGAGTRRDMKTTDIYLRSTVVYYEGFSLLTSYLHLEFNFYAALDYSSYTCHGRCHPKFGKIPFSRNTALFHVQIYDMTLTDGNPNVNARSMCIVELKRHEPPHSSMKSHHAASPPSVDDANDVVVHGRTSTQNVRETWTP
ncbi:hypothetical protein BS17DRAFT_366789 [Gyrodon lividus]|nr:hypothetical protein BS17DRAFT_366789 [Gyrodon lividus]